jgi:BRCA1-associated protein
MPSYFYHLKFELYPTPAPSPSPTPNRTGSGRAGTFADAQALGDLVWLPIKSDSIFDELPAHRRPNLSAPWTRQRQPQQPQQQQQQQQREIPSRPLRTQPALIDCGGPRPPSAEDERNIVVVSERQRRQLHQRTASFPPPQSHVAIRPETAVKDWRFDRLRIESLDVGTPREGDYKDMAGEASSGSTAVAAAGPSMSSAGKATKARYVPFKMRNTEIGWGIVHLYREDEETPELASARDNSAEEEEVDAEDVRTVDCTTVCIPAVPSYLSPSDFLGFIGDRWRDHISHYRLVMTGRMNRYLVLLKFRDGKRAQKFRHEFDGRVFNDIEPETCTVAFVRSITFETPTEPRASFPDLSQDPFTPSSSAAAGSLKPFPPPTPNLIELPTCPVCLERMDDTTGLLTIPCQHVFHCSCLQKWKGSGCPVCRHTNPLLSGPATTNNANASQSSSHDPSNPYTQPFGSHVSNLCSVCDSPEDLWICLICGIVGCGRYKGGHAKEHWKETAHTFALELDTQHVWDYAGDMWVHRLIRDKGDGKVVELPGRHDGGDGARRAADEDVVPRAKFDSIGMEYTHLLTSQLESQRVYFEEMLYKAADKAAQASAAAESAAAQASEALKELRALREEHEALKGDALPSLEKDLAREKMRATKSTDLARNLGRSLQEEKKVSEGLMKRIEHVNKELEALGGKVQKLELENADLKDQNHDLTMFISGQEKLKEMEAEGQIAQDELEEGSASVPESRRRRGKGRAKV